jgi:hypothetical protein
LACNPCDQCDFFYHGSHQPINTRS